MPCYEERKITLKFEAANLDLLTKALESMGYSVKRQGERLAFFGDEGSGTFQAGTITATSTMEEKLGGLKQAYSREVVKFAARKFGWNVKAQPGNANKMVVTRRTF